MHAARGAVAVPADTLRCQDKIQLFAHASWCNTIALAVRLQCDYMWVLYRLTARRISWTLTPHLTTMARGLLLPPSTLKDLADIANAELPAFVEAAVRGRNHSGFPQILIADDFPSATLLPVVLQLNGLSHRPPLR